MDIEFSDPSNPGVKFKTKGIWDTGATQTVITQAVVDALGLPQTGVTQVNTASERNKWTETYLVDLHLKSDVVIDGLIVNKGTILDGIECLIGMDIITKGDFVITNVDPNVTCMSFRIPSLQDVDFVKMGNEMAAQAELNKIQQDKRSQLDKLRGRSRRP